MSDDTKHKPENKAVSVRPGDLDSQGELVCRHYDHAAVALPETYAHGNGTVGFLQDWYASTPRGVVVKQQRQVLAEFFTSMLVLSAEFKYKPAVGAVNYLYYVDGTWSLSLIAPEQWSDTRREGFAGTCVLQRDRTWTITPSEQLTKDTDVADAVARFYDGFRAAMDTDGTLEDVLPFYAGKLSYYRRLNANALSRSLRATVTIGGQRAITNREWLLSLPRSGRRLLAAGDAA